MYNPTSNYNVYELVAPLISIIYKLWIYDQTRPYNFWYPIVLMAIIGIMIGNHCRLDLYNCIYLLCRKQQNVIDPLLISAAGLWSQILNFNLFFKFIFIISARGLPTSALWYQVGEAVATWRMTARYLKWTSWCKVKVICVCNLF